MLSTYLSSALFKNIIMFIRSLCPFWLAILLGVVVAAIVVGIIALVSNRKKLNIISAIVACCLAAALSFQMQGIVGGARLKHLIADKELTLVDVLSQIKAGELVSMAQDAFDHVGSLSSVVDEILDGSLVQRILSGDILDDAAQSAQSFVSRFVTGRVLWSLLFIAVATVLIILTMTPKLNGRGQGRTRYSSDDITVTTRSRGYSGSSADNF